MSTGDWIITISGALVALSALALLLWALLGDRLRTRAARRAGTLRRCPRCWYDMSATTGLTCPECGRTAKYERRLLRSRRRDRWAAASLLLLTLAAATLAYPHGKNNVWRRWLPDTAVILLIPHTDHWAAEEIGRRLGFRSTLPIIPPDRLSEWQWGLLHANAQRAWLNPPDPTTGGALWWLVVMAGPVPEGAFDRLVELTASDNRADREWAFRCLDRSRFWLTETQLARAKAAIEHSPAQSGFNERLRQNPIKMLGIQLASRADDPLADRVARWEQVPLNPDALLQALDHKSVNELIALDARLHFPRTMLSDTDESVEDAIAAERIDTHLNDDDLTDCVILLHNRTWEHRGSNIHYEAFALLQQPRGWRLLARLDLSNCLEGPPRFLTAESDHGRRWLIVRRDAGSSNDGQYYILQDAWLRVRAGRLTLDQTVLHRGINTGKLNRTLESAEPRVIRRNGKHLAAYDITSTMTINPDNPAAPPAQLTLSHQRGTFEYPLGVPETKLGQFIAPGPWDGKDPTHLFLGGPEVLTACAERLLELANTGDEQTRAAILAVIDEFVTWAGPTDDLLSLREQVEPASPHPPG